MHSVARAVGGGAWGGGAFDIACISQVCVGVCVCVWLGSWLVSSHNK